MARIERLYNENDYTEQYYFDVIDDIISIEGKCRWDKDSLEDRFDWDDGNQNKWCIHMDHDQHHLEPFFYRRRQHLFMPYFSSQAIANLAIETFRDELSWYFNEYSKRFI